jgi:hypothetical protein
VKPAKKAAMLAAIFGLATAACADNDGPAENFGEQVDDAVDEAREGVEDAADEVRDAADEVGDALDNQ